MQALLGIPYLGISSRGKPAHRSQPASQASSTYPDWTGMVWHGMSGKQDEPKSIFRFRLPRNIRSTVFYFLLFPLKPLIRFDLISSLKARVIQLRALYVYFALFLLLSGLLKKKRDLFSFSKSGCTKLKKTVTHFH